MNTRRHKVFVSYHHTNDQAYREEFESLFSQVFDVMISKSVQIGDIDPCIKTNTIRRKIREEYLKDSTVTVVLIGCQTWQRKHVDWEIGSSIRNTSNNPRSGLLGIFLPTHPDYGCREFYPYTIPPRLYYNQDCGFAQLYHWNTDPYVVQAWIHKAFEDRYKILPDNSYPSFVYNRTGERWHE